MRCIENPPATPGGGITLFPGLVKSERFLVHQQLGNAAVGEIDIPIFVFRLDSHFGLDGYLPHAHGVIPVDMDGVFVGKIRVFLLGKPGRLHRARDGADLGVDEGVLADVEVSGRIFGLVLGPGEGLRHDIAHCALDLFLDLGLGIRKISMENTRSGPSSMGLNSM